MRSTMFAFPRGKKNHIALARIMRRARADICAVLNAIVGTPVVFFSSLNDRNQKDELRVVEDSNPRSLRE